MKFIYPFAKMPAKKNLLKQVNKAGEKLYRKFTTLDVKKLPISDYNKRYLNDYMKTPEAIIQRYAYILAWALSDMSDSLEDAVFLDYGGGSGVLSLLAKELPLKSVIYNDIYEISGNDARIVGQALGNEADGYVIGGVDAVLDFVRDRDISIHAVGSYDVIEHIYDIEDFLKKLPEFSKESLTIFLSSGANMFNQRIVKVTVKKQIQAEYEGQKKTFGTKKRDCTRPYLAVREEMIRDYRPSLSDKEVAEFAAATRGLIEPDVRKQVDRYVENGEAPQPPDHPTNTCDPYTGNWMEHFMNPYQLQKTLTGAGIDTRVAWGYYGRSPSKIKRALSIPLNIAIRFIPRLNRHLSPFYSLYGKKR
ncbi:MAG: hypothetical protein B6244_11300 [Candidatus Cloacimonetes bacterium 4572_55]|nr:MAG: hypothetical protein B6244_11300 [Candidatus Cloacimonetes bacterium 4572_55]